MSHWSLSVLLHISTSQSLEVFTCLNQSQVKLSCSLLQSLQISKGHCQSLAVTTCLDLVTVSLYKSPPVSTHLK